MGKIRTRTIGLEDVEEQQKKEQKERAAQKKVEKLHKEEKKAKKASSKAMEELKAVEEKEKLSEETSDKAETKHEAKKEEKKVEPVKTHKRGKKYKAAAKAVEKNKTYTLVEAIAVLKKVKYADFDESVELHLNVLENNLKGEVELPHTTGKTVRIKIVDDALLDQLENGIIDFDILVTHPSYMPKLAKFARTLGPKGLMPNPKAGTISPNPEDVVKKYEKGVLKWKTEAKFPLIHQMIGKISHDEKALVENAESFLHSVGSSKIKAAFIKTTMSPSLKVTV